jgi:hypothetical protein
VALIRTVPGRRPCTLLALVLVTTLASCEKPVKDPQEAAQRVLDTPAWMSISVRCPADVMKSDMRINSLGDEQCGGEALPECFRRCRARDVDACFWLASALQAAEVDSRASEALYQRACLLGEPSGCTNRAAGMLYFDGDAREVRRCANRTFEKTCGFDDSWGCTMYGRALHEGLGVRRDDTRALEVLEKACVEEVRDDERSCQAATGLIEQIRGQAGATAPP